MGSPAITCRAQAPLRGGPGPLLSAGSPAHAALDLPTAGTSSLASLIAGAPAMATLSPAFPSPLAWLGRPLAFLVLALFMLALQRAER